jgi:hypothetical protein
VTMPIHPLRGVELKLIRMQHDHLAQRQIVIAEVEDGSHIVLPIDWTDRGAPWVTPRVGRRDVKLCAHGLLLLAGALEAASIKLGPSPDEPRACGEAEHSIKMDVSCRDRSGRVGGPDAHDTARPARRVGDSAAQADRGDRGVR